jgi:hypothetical protein
VLLSHRNIYLFVIAARLLTHSALFGGLVVLGAETSLDSKVPSVSV